MPITTKAFQKTIWEFYQQHKRELSWRDTRNPYKVFISEVMLQQTQVHRVIPKYEQFIQVFPDFKTLAEAPFSKVLTLWKGLGYNRRAKYVQESARIITSKYNGELPTDPALVDTLPGIGYHTARSIVTFAYNIKTVFIETNIRTVFIHFFFNDRVDVHDKELMPLIEKTVDEDNPREWYYALMDYGSMLKKTIGNKSRQSIHYKKQSTFEGSVRQMRGRILELLLQKNMTEKEMKLLLKNDERIDTALFQLLKEKLIIFEKNSYAIA